MVGTIRNESRAEFHSRMIKRCEVLAERYDRAAVMAKSERSREAFTTKAIVERANAQLHRERLAALSAI